MAETELHRPRYSRTDAHDRRVDAASHRNAHRRSADVGQDSVAEKELVG